MIQKGARRVAEALRDTMQTYLPDVLTDIRAAWGNDVPLGAPTVYYSTLQVDTPEPTVLEVDVRAAMQRANSANTSLTEGFGDVDYEFSVLLTFSAQDVIMLQQMAQMYAEGLWEVLMQHNTLDDLTNGLTGVDPLQMGTQFSGTDLKNLNVTVGWRGVAHVFEQTVG